MAENEETPITNAAGVQGVTQTIYPPVPYEEIDNPDGDGHLLIVHKDYEVDTNTGPREGARSHCFDDVRNFAEWLIRHGKGDSAEVLVDDDEICAVLDPKSDAPEVVRCRLAKTPEFEAWEAVFGQPMNQKAAETLA